MYDDNAVLINKYVEDAYLDYSMYVILERALPHIADGFKPVHRRIIYAMDQLKIDHKAKHMKSARTVGDVLGKYHPHGDSACYEAMVLMAQPFSMRQPLIDGQGNWGAQDDPKSFAAMRYTEARLSPFSQLLLGELGNNTVEFKPNFDGTMQEPVLLPAQIPNILINGGSGIAVGMATDVLPHNINEVIEATKYAIDNPKCTTRDLMQFIKGPDFPTGGIVIITPADLEKMYETGRGTLKGRAKYHIEKNTVVITELPYKVSGEKILEQVGKLMVDKKLPMLDDAQDESDSTTPTRLTLTLKRSAKVDLDTFMQHMFKVTDLESNFKYNANMIGLDSRPEVKSMSTILVEWAEFRRITVTRRLDYRLKKIETRLHTIEGLMVAYLNLDEVIRIVREEDKPKEALMESFGLTEAQANSILDLKLRNLAKLEEMELRKEQTKLESEAAKLESILNSKVKMSNLIKKELDMAVDLHGNERRTVLVSDMKGREAKELKEEDLISSEPMTVMMSKKGWLRAGKGHDVDHTKLTYKNDDEPFLSIQTHANKQSIMLDATGRGFTIKNHLLPSARGYGNHLGQFVTNQSGIDFVGLMSVDKEARYLFISKEGYGFKGAVEEIVSANKKGKAVLTTKSEGALSPVRFTDNEYIVVVSKKGMILIFPSNDLAELSKGKGNKLINLADGDEILLIEMISDGDVFTLHGKKDQTYTPGLWVKFLGTRNRRGKKLSKVFTSISVKRSKKVEEAPDEEIEPTGDTGQGLLEI